MRTERITEKQGFICFLLVAILAPSMSLAQPIFGEPCFTFPISQPWLCETADFNNDGFDDFIVTGYSPNSLHTFLSLGNGTFSHVQYSLDCTPETFSIGKFNSDSYPDIVIGEGNSGDNIRVYLGDGSGGFQGSQVINMDHYSVNTGDLDGDGYSELILPHHSLIEGDAIEYLDVWLSDGDGHFTLDSTYTAGNFLFSHLVFAPGDLNSDGNVDVAYIPRSGYRFGILLGNGDGTLQPEYFTGVTNGVCQDYPTIAAGDFNNDGNLDMAASCGFGWTEHYVYLNDGTGYFLVSDSLDDEMVWLIARDFDLDGNLDLGGSGASVEICLGLGDGTFTEPTVSLYPSFGQLGSADFDNDGDMDLVRINLDSGPLAQDCVYVYLNSTIQQGIEGEAGAGQEYLLSVSPCPFMTNLSISVGNPSGSATVQVLDLAGRNITQLILDPQGRAHWNGEMRNGVPAPPGVYLLNLSSDEECSSVRVLKL